MCNFSINCDINRKFENIKDDLYNGGLYSDQIVCRVKTTTGGDDIFDLDGTTSITDTVVNAIVERGPIINNYNNMIEVADRDIKLTVREEDAQYIDNAQEIWIDQTIVDGVPIYENDTLKTFASGEAYIERSDKPSIYNHDRIYIMGLKGELS